ncbi:MAG: TonB-dependent receptor plug domain-containing protein, partial [Steroidobacteraceae bacterium]
MKGNIRFAAAHTLLAMLLFGSQWARAQAPSSAADAVSGRDSTPRTELSEVVVTGTRIAHATPTSPVITIGRPQIDESGYSSIGQLLLAIPANFSGGQNPGVIGARGNNQVTISGAYSANIHGLGADSTLTLLDGHRFAYDAFQNGVDLSVVPLAAVDRVEVVTDGASAIYGSDAVAGVVNVILKQHYDGVTADARYGDVTSGHGAQTQYSLLGGHDWASGNALVAYEYAHSDPLFASDRPFAAGAAEPTTLLPELNRNTGFARLRQQLGDSVTASVDALYTARTDVQISTTGGSIDYIETSVRQYGISPTVSIDLPGEWTASLDGTVSHDEDDQTLPTVAAATGAVTRSSSVSYANDLRLAELHGSGPVVQLPSGPVEVAVGAGYRYERFRNILPPLSTTPPVDANRNVRFGFVEAQAPLVEPDASRTLLQRFDVNAAFRYERYSDFGGQPTPKVGFNYVPSSYLHLRATWSESFRAPEFFDVVGPKQLYLFPAAPFGGTAGTTALLAFGANADLGPEKARSTTFGFDLLWPERPSFRLTPTYFHIDYDERIVEPIDNMARALSNPHYAPFIT